MLHYALLHDTTDFMIRNSTILILLLTLLLGRRWQSPVMWARFGVHEGKILVVTLVNGAVVCRNRLLQSIHSTNTAT